MKHHPEENSGGESDTPLTDLLREALPVPQRPNPAFRTEVWQRIEAMRGKPATWSLWLRQHVVSVGGIALACVFLAIAGGGWLALEQRNRLREQQLSEYMASIDAYQHLATQPGSRTFSQ